MFHDAFSVCFAAACPQAPVEPKPGPREARAQRRRSSHWADILTIGASPSLEAYLEGLFQPSGWIVSGVPGRVAACEFLQNAAAAVAVCEELLPDGSWRDVALDLNPIPNRPVWVVVGDDWSLSDEVSQLGGFDTLTRPLDDSEVVWSIASAWHEWMKRTETGGGGTLCSGA